MAAREQLNFWRQSVRKKRQDPKYIIVLCTLTMTMLISTTNVLLPTFTFLYLCTDIPRQITFARQNVIYPQLPIQRGVKYYYILCGYYLTDPHLVQMLQPSCKRTVCTTPILCLRRLFRYDLSIILLFDKVLNITPCSFRHYLYIETWSVSGTVSAADQQ